MLEHVGEDKAARRLFSAIEAVTSRGDILTPDLGGKATTREVTDAVIGALQGVNA
jgi:tartrate dehydrogenase/decarboxylase/D-malate dehydrogenase